MKKFLVYVKKYRAAFILAPVFMLSEVFGEIWLPKLMSMIINNGVARHDTSCILRIGGVMLAAVLLMIIGGTLGNYFAAKASVGFSADLRKDLFRKVQTFSFANIDDYSTGSLVTRLTNDVQQIAGFINMGLKMTLRSPGMMIGGIIMAVSISPELALILLVAMPLLIVSIVLILRLSFPKFQRMQTAVDGLNNGIKEALTNIRVIKSFVREDFEDIRFAEKNTNLRQKSIDAMNAVISVFPVMMIIMNMTSCAVVWFGGSRVIAGKMQVGDLTAFITYITQILSSLMMLAMIFLQSSRAIVSLRRTSEILETVPDIQDMPDCDPGLRVGSGCIEFRDVSFVYPERSERDAETGLALKKSAVSGNDSSFETAAPKKPDREGAAPGQNAAEKSMSEKSATLKTPAEKTAPENAAAEQASPGRRGGEEHGEKVLEHISLSIRSGETVGILGATGCGKTTLVQLIPRLYDATEGEILVDGRNVKDYTVKNLREGVGMVLQNNTLFSGTVSENLRWGNEEASDEEVCAAAQQAQADQFVSSFTEGYASMIEQGGTNVSGGQKQRLCIARALLKKPKILILDDSTSAVDTATEARIREAFATTLRETTKLIIAQRIGSVRDADRIIVMEDGKIADIGSHRELMKRCREYQEICRSQLDADSEAELEALQKEIAAQNSGKEAR